MPNLKPPITTVDAALAYRQRILNAVPKELNFDPLMTLYLTDSTSADEIAKVAREQFVIGIKLYPAGATTNSQAGVTDLNKLMSIFETMESFDIPLLIHGEVADPNVDIFDREKIFIDQHLSKISRQFPKLRIVLEHITTRQAVQFVLGAPAEIVATITPQHLLFNRNQLLTGGIKPHLYCLPILKREIHRTALLSAAISGNPKFFLGTDSAPHYQSEKESDCGCAGCYSAHAAIELYAQVFDKAGAIDKLEGFASFFGPDFYGISHNKSKLTVEKTTWTVPPSYPFGSNTVIPLMAGETLNWRVLKKTG